MSNVITYDIIHISYSYDMSYVITFDVWEVRIMSSYLEKYFGSGGLK